MSKNRLKSILTGHTGTFSRNTIVSMLFLLFCLVSCSNSVFDSKVLPEKIKYKKGTGEKTFRFASCRLLTTEAIAHVASVTALLLNRQEELELRGKLLLSVKAVGEIDAADAACFFLFERFNFIFLKI